MLARAIICTLHGHIQNCVLFGYAQEVPYLLSYNQKILFSYVFSTINHHGTSLEEVLFYNKNYCHGTLEGDLDP